MTTAARTVYYAAASLDGCIAESDDGLDWLINFGGGDATQEDPEGYPEFYEGVGALVMGARTYDVMVGGLVETWPYAGKPTYVYAHRERAVMDGADVRFVKGEVGARHAEMLDAAGDRQLWVVGGGRLASQYLPAGLLDELRVTVVPVWLGGGLPLLAERTDAPMRLTGTTRFSSGMVELRYDLRS